MQFVATDFELADSGSFRRNRMAAGKIKIPARGAIAQLGERIVRNDEVAGSIPVTSTKFKPPKAQPAYAV